MIKVDNLDRLLTKSLQLPEGFWVPERRYQAGGWVCEMGSEGERHRQMGTSAIEYLLVILNNAF